MLVAAAALASTTAACRSAGDDPTIRGSTRQPDVSVKRGRGPEVGETSQFAPPERLAEVDIENLGESSGLAASRTQPGKYWTHNDSGDKPLVYCIDGYGRPCGVWNVTGAEAQDWEDMAVGPGPEPGRSYLYLADIGDNGASRRSVVVYRVAEPGPESDSAASSAKRPRATEQATAIGLRYADGPRDAEALLVHPQSGAIYVLSKRFATTAVYQSDNRGGLERIAELTIGPADWITGGDISPNGRQVVLSTLSWGLELSLAPDSGGNFDEIWASRPAPFDLGSRRQGESVAYRLDGQAVLATSEGSPMPLWQAQRRRSP